MYIEIVYLLGENMKMVRKLKFIVIPLILLPFVIIFMAILAAGNSYLVGAYGHNADINDITTLGNPVQTVITLTSETYVQLKTMADTDPDVFSQASFLDEMNNELKESNSYLLVKVEDDMSYCGNDSFDEKIFKQLPEYWDENTDDNVGIYIYSPESYYVRQLNFVMKDKHASAYILTYMGDVVPQFKRIIIKMIFIIGAVLIMVSMFISWYMYWEFIRPINALMEGTNYIKDGNLEKDVEVMNDDEIGDLCQSFNEMRGKLKDSIDVRLQYEHNNRELISNISHDLKTPITAIKGYVEGIMDGVADTPEKMDKYIKTIYNKANEMDALINELGMYSKIDNNAIPYNFRSINVDSYFGDCIEDIKMELESNNIELAYFNYCDRDTNVIMDPEQIKRVINNIISNSMKYNDKKKGHINIRLKADHEYVHVEIEDNGKGVGEKDIFCVFNRMYRADSSRNSATGGSGLGLSIAKKIIEEHGGEIIASSKEGVGMTIGFTLRIEKEETHE